MEHTQDVGGTVVAAGCDYLTVNCSREIHDCEVLDDWWQRMMDATGGKEPEPKKIKHGCYEGIATQHLFRGEWKGRLCFRAGGDVANEALAQVVAVGDDVRPTRVDLKVDVKRAKEPTGFARATYDMVREIERKKAAWDGRTMKLIEPPKNAHTVYIGSTQGNDYLCRYNKSKEQKGLIGPNIIRDERRFSEIYAQRIMQVLRKRKDVAQVAVDANTAFFRKCGIEPNYSVPSDGFILPTIEHVSSDEQFVQYIERQLSKRAHAIEDPRLRWRMAVALGVEGSYRDIPDEAFNEDLRD